MSWENLLPVPPYVITLHLIACWLGSLILKYICLLSRRIVRFFSETQALGREAEYPNEKYPQPWSALPPGSLTLAKESRQTWNAQCTNSASWKKVNRYRDGGKGIKNTFILNQGESARTKMPWGFREAGKAPGRKKWTREWNTSGIKFKTSITHKMKTSATTEGYLPNRLRVRELFSVNLIK